jgi:glucan phosphoethanolaminetransferase (alkaline phosphatase superfamily)
MARHRSCTTGWDTIRANLLIDENACSSRGSTPPSMKEIFTFADRDHENLVHEQPNFLELTRADGYRLYWLSNHRAADESVYSLTNAAGQMASVWTESCFRD